MAAELVSKQGRLTRTLYRNLARRTRDIPASACLQKYNLTLAGVKVEDAFSLQEGLRSAFRLPAAVNGEAQKQLQAGMKGLRILNSLDLSALPAKSKDEVVSQKFTHPSAESLPEDSTIYYYGLEKTLDQLNWISVKADGARDVRIESSDLPLLPVMTPHVPELHAEPMSLIGHLYDVPVPGYQLDLPIFEQRFIDLYEDLQKQGPNGRIVVPFSHPILPGVFAEYGVLYEIRGIEDMQEKTLGSVKYKAHHTVLGKPVRLEHVSNPSAFCTEETYMRVKAEIINVDMSKDPRKCKENHDMIEMLRWWMCPLAEDLYGAIDYGVWGLVSVWIGHLQQELMELQANVIARVENKMDKDPSQDIHDVVREIQGRGYKERMIEIQVQLSTMIPRLLPLNNKEQYLMLQQMILEEQERQRAIEDDLPLVV